MTTSDEPTVSVVPAGFERIAARATARDGTACRLCLWLADSPERRSRGLMEVTDLGGADGMVFRYPSPHSGSFWMKNTVLALSIAFYAPDGWFIESFDMEPCRSDPCPRYRTPREFLLAVEVPVGDLERLGLTAGSRLVLTDAPCD